MGRECGEAGNDQKKEKMEKVESQSLIALHRYSLYNGKGVEA